MNVYVWQRLSQVSENFHAGGGLVIVAADLDAAKAMAAEYRDPYFDTTGTIEIDKEPTAVYETKWGTEPALYVFPDAGCC